MNNLCIDCKKEIGPQAKRCSPCNYKWMSENKINPGNYKDGSYQIKPCIDCRKLLPKGDQIRCKECYKIVLSNRMIENPPKKGRITTKEVRIKQSIIKLNYFGTLGEERKNPYVFDWNIIRKEIYKRDNWTCQECGIKCTDSGTSRIQCHHIDYNKQNNDEKNLITLCLGCHQPTNYNRDFWKFYYQEKILQLIEI